MPNRKLQFIIMERIDNLDRQILEIISQNAQQFNFENQSRERFDLIARFSSTISKFLRDVKFPFRTYRHHSQCFCPTFDYLVELLGIEKDKK